MENAEESDERWKFEEVVGEDWKQGAALLRLECLHKWDLRESCALQCFSVDHAVRRLQVPALLRHFFADEDVLSRLQVCLSRGTESGRLTGAKGIRFQLVPLRVTRTDMSLFDRLKDPENMLVRSTGSIIKCADVYLDHDMVASDRLREMLMDPCSEQYDLFSEDEKEEFLFHIFRRLAIGGALNQYEDELEPLLDVTKSMYKALVSVHKNPDTLLLEIPSLVYELREFRSEEGGPVYANESAEEWNFTYIVVDPVYRRIYRWYHSHLPVF